MTINAYNQAYRAIMRLVNKWGDRETVELRKGKFRYAMELQLKQEAAKEILKVLYDLTNNGVKG